MRKLYAVSVFLLFWNTLIFSQIYDIKSFLNQCPTNDPAINTILTDFEIRLNGIKVTEFPCVEPVSAMSVLNYTNPLIYLQTLRVIYYMDRNMVGKHLPWTDKTLYGWMKENVNGINIRDGVSGGYCCEIIDGKKFFVTGNQDDFNREFDKQWKGISSNIDFFAHETRHSDPKVYPHSSCCGISGGCDDQYNENDLGAYGIQYWLNKSWLSGYLNVGARTSYSTSEINGIIDWHRGALEMFSNRFCANKPPEINMKDILIPLGPSLTNVVFNESGKLNLFPNPLSIGGKLTIVSPNIPIDKIEIYNLCGSILKVIPINQSGEIMLDAMNLKPNFYLVKISDTNKNIYFQKLIIQ